MKYICELCGKTHTTQEAANQCEINCQNEKERKVRLRAEQHERFDKLTKVIDDYNKNYNTKYRLINVSGSFSDFFLFTVKEGIMKEQIISILKQYINEMITFQSEYEYGCYERGLYPKSTYERIYNALHDASWMEEYLGKNGVNTSDFEIWYSVFLEARKEINIQELIDDYI